MEPESCGGAAKAPKGLFYHQVSLAQPMISQPIILLQRQHGVELGGPGQAMGLVEMELREDIVSQTIYSCFISSPEISITSGDLFLLLDFSPQNQVPKTCKNFIALCTGSSGYGYYHTTFHR